MKLGSRTHTTPTDQSNAPRQALKRDMIEPLDSRILSALACDDDDDNDNTFVPMAKRSLNENRNLSGGVSCLLETYKAFKAQLWQDEPPDADNKKGADSWHIRFRVYTQCQSTASLANYRSQRILHLATFASILRPLKLSSMFMYAKSLSSLSASSTTLKTG